MNILLNYFFPITTIDPTPQASTAFLKQACLVVKPSGSAMSSPLLCTTMAAVNAVTANTEAQQLFNAGMNRVFVLAVNDLDIALELTGHESDFFTLIVSSDFVDADWEQTKAAGTITVTSYANLIITSSDTMSVAGTVFTAQAGAATPGTATFQAATSNNATAASLAAQINAHAVASTKVLATVLNAVVTVTALTAGASQNALALIYTDTHSDVGITVSGATLTGGAGIETGAFAGVVGISSTNDTLLAALAANPQYAPFHTSNGAKNMCFAFGSMLANAAAWLNQQYITMPFADDVTTLGAANNLFDSKVNFVISDDTYGNRLALFAVGGKAIVAPYIIRNFQLDIQSEALTYISGNEPDYTLAEASLLNDELNKVGQSYVDDGEITAFTIDVTLDQDNFVADAEIDIAEPKAMWRVFANMKETL